MEQVIPILIFIIPVLGMLSGFSISLTGSLFIIFLALKTYVFSGGIRSYTQFRLQLNNYKLEIILFLWCLISCFFGVNFKSEIISLFQISFGIVLCLLLRKNLYLCGTNKDKIFKPLFYGIIASVILFYVEYYSAGIISSTFRYYFQKPSNHKFFLYYLDRGCAFMAVLSWGLLKLLIDKKKPVIAAVFYFCILYLLNLSDSLATLIAYIIAGIIFLLLQAMPSLNRFFTICLILGSLLLPFIFFKINPAYIADNYETMPISAKHRLFIWNFVAEKAMRHPFIGRGFNASKHVIVEENINYREVEWSLLPLHPHNNILQILFELGLSGLILFLAVLYKHLKNINDPAIYACFISYYIIGMISYNMWQSWWVFGGLFIYLIMGFTNQSLKPNVHRT